MISKLCILFTRQILTVQITLLIFNWSTMFRHRECRGLRQIHFLEYQSKLCLPIHWLLEMWQHNTFFCSTVYIIDICVVTTCIKSTWYGGIVKRRDDSIMSHMAIMFERQFTVYTICPITAPFDFSGVNNKQESKPKLYLFINLFIKLIDVLRHSQEYWTPTSTTIL